MHIDVNSYNSPSSWGLVGPRVMSRPRVMRMARVVTRPTVLRIPRFVTGPRVMRKPCVVTGPRLVRMPRVIRQNCRKLQ